MKKYLSLPILLLALTSMAYGQSSPLGSTLPGTTVHVRQDLGGGRGQMANAVVPINVKFTVPTASLVAIGAATSGNVLLANLPAKAVVLATTVKHSAAIVGPSISAATARVTTANNNYGTAFDVFQAPSATALDFYATPKSENFAAVTPVNLAVVLTGANASVITAGAIDVYITYYVRQ